MKYPFFFISETWGINGCMSHPVRYPVVLRIIDAHHLRSGSKRKEVLIYKT